MTVCTPLTKIRSVLKMHVANLDHVRPGFSTRNIGPSNLGSENAMDPFVNLDDFLMDRPTFGPHPHAGFSAITYMFEDSSGSFVNRWSKSDKKDIIGPGSFHWTQAGSGMMHEEVPVKPGVPCHGLQMFVKLPSEKELTDPQAFHADPKDIPVVEKDGARVHVLAGSYEGQSCGTELQMIGNEGLTFLDVHLQPGATFTTPASEEQTAIIFTITGRVASVAAPDDEIEAHTGVLFARDGNTVSISSSSGAQFLFGSGTPNNEPLVASGPFMMSTVDRISQAKHNYASGAMGRLEPSF